MTNTLDKQTIEKLADIERENYAYEGKPLAWKQGFDIGFKEGAQAVIEHVEEKETLTASQIGLINKQHVGGGEAVATVINNNQEGWTNIVETKPHVTLDIGTKLYLHPQPVTEPVAWAVFNESTNSYEFISDWRQGANEHINDMPTEMIKAMRLVPMFAAPPVLEAENARLKEEIERKNKTIQQIIARREETIERIEGKR